MKSNHDIIKIIKKCGLYALYKLLGYNRFYKFIIGNKKYNIQYDYVIAYEHDSYGSKFNKWGYQFVINKFDSNCKIAWNHKDYDTEACDLKDMEMKYKFFNEIVCVSEANKNSLIKLLPNIENKVRVEYNHFDKNLLLFKANQYKPFLINVKLVNIITVCRLSYAKGIDRIFNIVHKLLKTNIRFIWRIIGQGNNEYSVNKLNKKCKELNIDSVLIFLGQKINPYPYIKNSDIFAFPTRMEACPMVIDEAKLLNTYVATCNYPAAKEQINNINTGIICDNSEDGLYNALIDIIKNKRYVELKKIHI